MRREIDIERRIAALATRQDGVITRAELLELGLGPAAIDHRVRSGRLQLLHRAVYAAGHRALRPEGHWRAAVLACGPGAVLSHASAALAWDLRATRSSIIDVTVPSTAGRRRRRGTVRIHRRASLPLGEITIHRGIPITTVARTLFDLAATIDRRQLERAMDEAEVRNLFDGRAVRAVLAAHRGAPGAARLRSVLESHTAGSTLTRTELEELFLGFCDRHGFARPLVNRTVAGLEIDFLWHARRLAVEVDGWAFHRTRSAFERDHERDALLAPHGIHVLRFTDRQIKQRPGEVRRALVAWAAPRAVDATRAA